MVLIEQNFIAHCHRIEVSHVYFKTQINCVLQSKFTELDKFCALDEMFSNRPCKYALITPNKISFQVHGTNKLNSHLNSKSINN